MDEELQKRNTDCVYFLASPLTCKKGMECEYRHSEIARLNPRDCWYWLAGSCLNPTCGFRHPPLDTHTEKLSEAASHYNHKTVPVKKTDVPCFFFFNGVCSKGYKCSFLHGHDDAKHVNKPSKSASVESHGILEKKISIGGDTGSTHIDANPNPSETVLLVKAAAAANDDNDSTQNKAKQELKHNIEERSVSTRTMMAALEGDDEANRFIQRRSVVCIDQRSDENVDGGYIEREDWLESSPGFDVLVDDRLEIENMGYEQDQEYLLNDQSKVYDYEEEDSVGYNHLFQEGRILYEQEISVFHDLDDDDEITYDYISKTPVCSRERMLINTLPGRKRKFLPAENGRNGVDLRDHLKKQRVVFDGHLSRKHGSAVSARLISQSRQRHRRNYIVGSRFENEALFKGKQRGPRLNKSRLLHTKEKRQGKQQFPLSQVSQKSILKKRRNSEEPGVFTGPKSLNQIKEEKKRAEQIEESDFQGPKPLSEILKDKRKQGLVTDDGYNYRAKPN